MRRFFTKPNPSLFQQPQHSFSYNAFSTFPDLSRGYDRAGKTPPEIEYVDKFDNPSTRGQYKDGKIQILNTGYKGSMAGTEFHEEAHDFTDQTMPKTASVPEQFENLILDEVSRKNNEMIFNYGNLLNGKFVTSDFEPLVLAEMRLHLTDPIAFNRLVVTKYSKHYASRFNGVSFDDPQTGKPKSFNPVKEGERLAANLPEFSDPSPYREVLEILKKDT